MLLGGGIGASINDSFGGGGGHTPILDPWEAELAQGLAWLHGAGGISKKLTPVGVGWYTGKFDSWGGGGGDTAEFDWREKGGGDIGHDNRI